MPAATLEQSSEDTAPVFVAGGRSRNHAVRLAAATLGILFAGWLAALAAGLIGFSPLPKLALPSTGNGQTAPAPSEQGLQPARERDADAHTSSVASGQAPRGDQIGGARSTVPGASGSGTGVAGGQTRSGAGGTGSTSSDTGAGPSQPQTDPPGGGQPTPANSGQPPPFTPPASGEKSAGPPRGNSANAPGRANSADPPGKANSAKAPGRSTSANPPGRATRAHSG